jgi:hypothetical protein
MVRDGLGAEIASEVDADELAVEVCGPVRIVSRDVDEQQLGL